MRANFGSQNLWIMCWPRWSETGANPNNLKIELSESMFGENVEDVITRMNKLKSLRGAILAGGLRDGLFVDDLSEASSAGPDQDRSHVCE